MKINMNTMLKADMCNLLKLIRAEKKQVQKILQKMTVLKIRKKNENIIEFLKDVCVYALDNTNTNIFADNSIVVLKCRRLFELFIICAYIGKNDNYDEFKSYALSEAFGYWDSLIEISKDTPEVVTQLENDKKEMEKYFNDIKPKKTIPLRKMAENLGVFFLQEYKSIYKLSSSILHCCPFSLNVLPKDLDDFHKIILLTNSYRYLQMIRFSMETILIKNNLIEVKNKSN